MSHQPIVASARLRSQVERLGRMGCSEFFATHFARAILGLGDPVLDCNTCQAALPEHIEAELNNRSGSRHRAMRGHLDLCPVCNAIYLDLLEIALSAEQGPLPRPDLGVALSFLK